MAKTHNFVVLQSPSGWYGLYDNGKLVSEGFSLTATDVITYLGIPCEVKKTEVKQFMPNELPE